MAPAVKTKVVELKRRRPDLGIEKISQFLRRVLFLPVSRETVRRTLHEQQLLQGRKLKPPRNPARPRFFERSTSNQLWQTDISTFRSQMYLEANPALKEKVLASFPPTNKKTNGRFHTDDRLMEFLKNL